MSHYKSNRNLLNSPIPDSFFSDCYSQHRQSIYTYLLDRAEDANLALDLIQNVFLKFWTLRNQYHGIENVRGYLIQMAEKACRQDKNGAVYIQMINDDSETSTNLIEVMFDEWELRRTFQQAVLDLSKQRKIVIVLSQIEGWPREKIASILKISPFTVKITLQNAQGEIRKKCTLPAPSIFNYQKQIK